MTDKYKEDIIKRIVVMIDYLKKQLKMKMIHKLFYRVYDYRDKYWVAIEWRCKKFKNALWVSYRINVNDKPICDFWIHWEDDLNKDTYTVILEWLKDNLLWDDLNKLIKQTNE